MKLKIIFGVFVLLLISVVTAHAQNLPCNGDDPDGPCPIDTWVIVLVLATSIFAALRLYNRKKLAA